MKWNRFIKSTLTLSAILGLCAPLAAFADQTIVVNAANGVAQPTVLVQRDKDVVFDVVNPTSQPVWLDVSGTNIRNVAVVPPGCERSFYLDMSTDLNPQVQYSLVSSNSQPLVSGNIVNMFGETGISQDAIAALDAMQRYDVYSVERKPEPVYNTAAPARHNQSVRGFW